MSLRSESLSTFLNPLGMSSNLSTMRVASCRVLFILPLKVVLLTIILSLYCGGDRFNVVAHLREGTTCFGHLLKIYCWLFNQPIAYVLREFQSESRGKDGLK